MAEPVTDPQPQQTPTAGLKYALPAKGMEIFSQVEQERGLPPGTLHGVFAAENSGHATLADSFKAESGTGARGPFQLTDTALRDIGRDPKTFDRKSFRANAEAAGDYAVKLDGYTKDVPAPAQLRIAGAWNLGPGTLLDGIKNGSIEPTIEGIDAASVRIGNGKFISKFQKAVPINMTTASESAPPTGATIANKEGVPAAEDRAAMLATAAHEDAQYAGGGTGAMTGENILRAAPGAISSVASGAWNNIIKPTAEGFMQFPNEVAQNVDALSGRGAQAGLGAVDSMLGTNMGPLAAQALPPPPGFITPDPMGAVNFGASIFSPAGRLASMGMAAGTGVLNAADAAAREDAAKAGYDWNGMPIGQRLSLTASKLDYKTMGDNLFSILGGTMLAGLLPPANAYQGKVQRAKDATDDAWRAAKAAVDEHNAPVIERANRVTDRNMWKWADKQRAEREGVELFNAEQEAARAIDESKAQAYAVQSLETQRKIAEAEGLTGLKRVPPEHAQWELALQEQNQKARDYMLSSVGLGSAENQLEDPSGVIFKNWLGDWQTPTEAAMRELPDSVKDEVNSVLDKVQREAKKSGRGDGPIGKLGRLGDPELDAKIEAARANYENLPPGHPHIGIAAAQLEKLEAKQKPVTVKDVADLVQSVDGVRRTRVFGDAATPGEKSLMEDLSKMLRQDDSVIERAMGPEDAAIWREGNAASREWSERKRITDMIGDAFKDILPGAETIRNNMYANRVELVKSLGKEKYKQLYDIAKAVDDLYLKMPELPKPTAQPSKKFIPGVSPAPKEPEGSIGWRSYPDKPGPEEWKKRMEGKRATDFMDSMNSLFSHMERNAATATVGGAIAGLSASKYHGADATTSGLIGAGTMAALITIPGLARAFTTAMEHYDKPTSRQYLQSVAKMVMIAQLHGAYTGYAGGQTNFDPTPPGAPPVAQTMTPPPVMPTRQVGGPVPGPSPGLGQPGMPRVKSMSPL
jgi:hypothetical protein